MEKIQDIPFDQLTKFEEAGKNYKFQPKLTKELDNLKGDFTEITLLEIVLWKTNRYPTITQDILADINELRKSYSEEKAKELLRKLLQKEIKGFDLPMASTVLRFACPNELQIIDQRVYRFITPGKDSLKIPHNIEEKIDLYFKYIEQLHTICDGYKLEFKKIDRILYQLDKTENKNIPLTTSSKHKNLFEPVII
jgi:thermostable 8-oxoguanine DNA glycosylase